MISPLHMHLLLQLDKLKTTIFKCYFSEMHIALTVIRWIRTRYLRTTKPATYGLRNPLPTDYETRALPIAPPGSSDEYYIALAIIEYTVSTKYYIELFTTY